jgi:hypothetical protein
VAEKQAEVAGGVGSAPKQRQSAAATAAAAMAAAAVRLADGLHALQIED